MSQDSIIVISPPTSIEEESELINQLFDLGIYRYHINKIDPTEQSIAEILEDLNPNYLNKISLHSHFHLVLAYGVGGIHFTQAHRLLLESDYSEKLKLYQGFGIKVSTEIAEAINAEADYFINYNTEFKKKEINTYYQARHFDKLQTGQYFVELQSDSNDESFKDLLDFLSDRATD